ncbi:MAG: glycosyltransferase [Pseudomonadota bacterium]
MIAFIATAALAVWIGLVFARHGFWRADMRDDRETFRPPDMWPAVTAIVPARDEADVIARSIGSLLAQDYAGDFRVVLVDDNSGDGTADIACALPDPAGRLSIIDGAPLADGWTGKLYAVSQGIEAASDTPPYLWLTDADIEHAPDTLSSLVSRAEARQLVLVSLMARLACITFAERTLVPAFVFFFQMLYPFRAVSRAEGMGAAAGGCMLVRRQALERAGGIAAVRDALIDDCAIGALMKREGRVWLGLTDRSRSVRPYVGWRPVFDMISRSAYAQLGYRPLALAGTIAGLALVYLAPPLLTLFADGYAATAGLIAWSLMTLSFQPMLAFYGRSPFWGIALPAIAAIYAGATLRSAWDHERGKGGMWKGRAQALGTSSGTPK